MLLSDVLAWLASARPTGPRGLLDYDNEMASANYGSTPQTLLPAPQPVGLLGLSQPSQDRTQLLGALLKDLGSNFGGIGGGNAIQELMRRRAAQDGSSEQPTTQMRHGLLGLNQPWQDQTQLLSALFKDLASNFGGIGSGNAVDEFRRRSVF